VVGLSLGGAVAQALALRAPDRVASLSIVCSAASFAPAGLWTERAAAVRAAATVAVPQVTAGLAARWFSEGFRRDNPAVVAEFVTGLCAVDPEGYASCCDALAAWDATDQLGRIGAPTLLVAGAVDPAAPVAGMQLMADRIAGSRLEVLPVSHLAPIEMDLSTVLLDHLRSSR
jgi:3-oxoadipate enol-lactonase/4-carboxymuconolactone decarboxylase